MRKVQTFVRRSRGIKGGAYHWLSRLSLEDKSFFWESSQNLEEVYRQPTKKRILDIGFGVGDALWEQASVKAEYDFLGVEVHIPGVKHLLTVLHEKPLENIKLYCGDVLELLKTFPENTFDKIQIFFPDPWPKKRHHKRRLLSNLHVPLMVFALKEGGLLHMATDWQPYAEEALGILQNYPFLVNTGELAQGFSDRRERPITKFEKRALDQRRCVWDLCFKKCAEKKNQ